MFRAKRTDNGVWIEGYLYRLSDKLNPFIMIPNCYGESHEVNAETVCRCVEKEYMDSDIAYEGDIFESQVSGDLMILRYGTYQAFCPTDNVFMDSVGFYAECKDYPNMPIGDLHEYALKKGNIFDNYNLLEEKI